MNIVVKLFAAARELAGQAEVTVAVAPGADVSAVREALSAQWPRLAALAAQSLIAVNAEYAGNTAEVCEGDVIALISPVSGG